MTRARPALKQEVIEVDEITLDGKKIVVRNEDIPVGRLRLDVRNPRIANTVALGLAAGGADADLEELLWSDPDVRDLYRQVLINKGLIERVIVKPDYSVVEGNCRLVVYKKLHSNYPSDPRWQRVPSRVLPSDIAERDVALLLGQMHVMGKNQWSPFEKAGHLHRLHREFVLTQEEIASRLRMSKSKVNQAIRAFEAMRDVFLPEYGGPGAVRRFSYFEELFKIPATREWATEDPRSVRRFADWVGTAKLSQGAQVRDLPKILQNTDALAAFERGGFAEARKVLEEEDPAISSPLFRSMVEMTRLLTEARLSDIQRVKRSGNPAAQRIVSELQQALTHFIALSGATPGRHE